MKEKRLDEAVMKLRYQAADSLGSVFCEWCGRLVKKVGDQVVMHFDWSTGDMCLGSKVDIGDGADFSKLE